MSSSNAKTTMRWSLAGKLVTLYVLTASTSLLLACGFLYWTLLSNIDREHMQLLSSELSEIKTILQRRPLNLNSLKHRVGEESKFANREHTASFHPSSAHYSYFRVLNSQQQSVVETNNMSTLFPTTVFSEVDENKFPPVDNKLKTDDGRKFLLITRYLPKNDTNPSDWYLQVALNITQDEALLIQYQKMLGLVLISGICFLTIAGFWITKNGLKSLHKITQAVQNINVYHLQETITAEKWPKELMLLASAFDDMLNRLDESFARLSQFSADLAHELRTPINNLMGETEVALSRQRTSSEYQQILESNMEELNRLSRMTEELLFLSRAEAPETSIHCEILAVEEELEKICKFYEGLAAEKNITIHKIGCAQIFADPVLLRRVLNNLVANAINYTDSGGEITLMAKPGNQFTEIRVSDNGIGIDSAELSKIFDRFYRADKARTKNTQGSGLGLSIVMSIINLHQGTVTVNSEAGEGTTVVLRFPSQSSDMG